LRPEMGLHENAMHCTPTYIYNRWHVPIRRRRKWLVKVKRIASLSRWHAQFAGTGIIAPQKTKRTTLSVLS